MDEDRIVGTARNLGGKVQEGYGRVTGDAQSQAQGLKNQAAGAAQDVYGQAKDIAANADDLVRRTIEQRPYTTAFAALAVGWLIGRMGRRD